MTTLSVKIIGAGSVGNHLANAFRKYKHKVTLTDIDPGALERTKLEIYPSRYQFWDEEIRTGLPKLFKDEEFDIVVIGTPPDTHLNIATSEMRMAKKAILIEKPLCIPDRSEIVGFEKLDKQFLGRIFVGYNHSASNMIQNLKTINILEKFDLGKILNINVFWEESWEGILRAHPWLNGAEDTYLGYTKRGGGALGEHSHGLKLLFDLVDLFGLPDPQITNKKIDWFCKYDQTSTINFEFKGMNVKGSYNTDVISWPARKGAEIMFKQGKLTIEFGDHSIGDTVHINSNQKGNAMFQFSKTRPLDFQLEVNEIVNSLNNKKRSSLDLKNCLKVQYFISECLEGV